MRAPGLSVPIRVIALALTAMTLLSACGGSSSSADAQLEPQGQRLAARDAELTVYPDTWLAGGSGEITLSESSSDREYKLAIGVQHAQALQGIFLRLSFDPQRFSPANVESASAFGPASETLSLDLRGQGVIDFGEMRLHPQDQSGAGVAGDARLLTITLLRQPQPLLRAVAAAPATDSSRTTLSLDAPNISLVWPYVASGDYNQDGQVLASDLAPIGIHFQEAVPAGQSDSIQAVVDGNGDGHVLVSDLAAIGQNFQAKANSYNVYASTSIADFPTSNSGPNGAGAEKLGVAAFTSHSGEAGNGRVQFSFTLEEIKPGWFYWVRPNDLADGSGNDGTPSTFVSGGGDPNNQNPVASLTGDPLSGNIPLSVSFDASGSTDPDGASGNLSDIIQFQWDFDGDGSVDESTATATIEHTYSVAGSLNASVTVVDLDAGTASASVAISAIDPDNTAPTAALTADPTSGEAPLTVTLDASGSSDADGSITQVEWDFDGDGVFDLATGTQLSVEHIYAELGTFNAKVRVTDNASAQAEASTAVEVVDEVPNQAPTAVLGSATAQGDAPLSVEFSFAGSTDADGSIVSYELFQFTHSLPLQFNSDPGPFSLSYPDPGVHQARLVVTDNEGLSAVAVLKVRVNDNGNEPPVAVIEASPSSGGKPLQVHFDAINSTDDGSIDEYRWDIDGDGSIDQTTSDSTFDNLYTSGGSFNSTVTVVDDGGLTDSASIVISIEDGDNVAPVADLQVNVLDAGFPLQLELDASGTIDPNDNIFSYNWDRDGDGTEDLVTVEPVINYSLFQQGTFNPSVRVEDAGHLDDSASDEVISSAGWRTVVVDPNSGAGNTALTSATVVNFGVANKSRKPCVAYFDSHNGLTKFVANTSPSDLSQWSTPVAVSLDQASGALSLFAVNSLPAVAYRRSGIAGTGGLSYVLASDINGTGWTAPVKVTNTGENSVDSVSALVIAGNPALAFSDVDARELKYVRASNALGTAWGSPLTVDAGNQLVVNRGQLFNVNGRPAICYPALPSNQAGQLRFERAGDNLGTDWTAAAINAAPAKADFATLSATRASMTIIGSNPAIAYADDSVSPTALRLVRALDADGSTWGTPVTVLQDSKFLIFRDCNLRLVGGKPAIACLNLGLGGHELLYIPALDANGDAWGPPQEIEQDATNAGEGCSLAVNALTPFISYFKLGPDGGGLKVAFLP